MKENREVEEAEANAFAMELLMPSDFVKSEIKKMKDFDICNDKHVKILADKFKVPQASWQCGSVNSSKENNYAIEM